MPENAVEFCPLQLQWSELYLFLMSVACIFHVFHHLAYFAGSCSSKMKTSVAGCPKPLIRWRPWRRSSRPVDITCRRSWVAPEMTWRKWETSSEGQSRSVLTLPLDCPCIFWLKEILLFSKNAFSYIESKVRVKTYIVTKTNLLQIP